MRSDSSDFEFAAAPASGNGELNLFFAIRLWQTRVVRASPVRVRRL